MSEKPDDIPRDVWNAAIECANTALRNLPDDYGDVTAEISAIARAILAERERCAKIAEAYGQSRSDISTQDYGLAMQYAAQSDAGDEIAQAIRTETGSP